jgi:acyl dehydratase
MTPPRVGQRAARSRTVRERDIELFTEMTGDRNPLHYDERAASASRFGAEVEVIEVREDKPITRLRTTITTREGVVVLDGSALVWTEPLG